MSTESVMTSNYLNFCHLLLLPSIFPSIRVFSNELSLLNGLLSVLKKKGILTCGATWMNLKDIVLSEITSQKMKNIIWFYFYEICSVVKFIQTECSIVVARNWGEERMKSYSLMNIEFQFFTWKIMEMDHDDDCVSNKIILMLLKGRLYSELLQ